MATIEKRITKVRKVSLYHKLLCNLLYNINCSEKWGLKKQTAGYNGTRTVNEFNTDPYCLQLGQSMTTDCLLISVFLPILTCFYLLRTQNCFVWILRTILGLQQVKTGKNFR